MTKKIKKVGRPPLKRSQIKKHCSVRVSDSIKRAIRKRYKIGLQAWIDKKVSEEDF